MAEISDAELMIKNRAVALLDKMIADPKEGLAMKRKIKEFAPDVNFPELNVIDVTTAPINAALDEQKKLNKTLSDRLDAWEKKQTDGKDEAELQSQLDGIKKQYSFTAEGMQKVVDRMKSKSNPDAEAAAAWVAAQERKAHPVTDSVLLPSELNLYGSSSQDDSFAELNKDPVKWADRELVNIINEFAEQNAA